MLAELVLSYNLISNEPVRLRAPGAPYLQHEIALNVEKHWEALFFKLMPYVQGSEANSVDRAGAFAEIGIHWGDVDISLYHHSSHNLDRPGVPLEVDGVRLRWRLK